MEKFLEKFPYAYRDPEIKSVTANLTHTHEKFIKKIRR